MLWWLFDDNGIQDIKYCDPINSKVEREIHRTHVAIFIKDYSITFLSALRVIYFIYVLTIVCRNSSKPFWKRPAFMNYLPVLILISSVACLFFGVFILKDTINGNGGVMCELKHADLYFTVAGTYFTGLYHYMFCAEFLNTSMAL